MRYAARLVLLASALLLVAPPTSPAHHSVAGQFDVSKPITLTGTISRVDWINPHVYIYLDVKDDQGVTDTWALATLPTAMMRRAGLTRDAVQGKPGETVTVNAIPARDGTKHLAWISRITYADGRYHQFQGQ